ncbi:MAG: hypothetical protein ACYCYF_01400 [Anaerolineae bacterium]
MANSPDRVAALVAYITSLSDFTRVPTQEPYSHVGATLTDALLQSGLRYETVVLPRVKRVLADPSAGTVSGFLRLLEREGPHAVLHWQHPDKPACVLKVTRLLHEDRVETEADLRDWLTDEGHCRALLGIKGIGLKTLDYIQFLAGIPNLAVDRHMLAFLKEAGIPDTGYEEAHRLLIDTAAALGWPAGDLDMSIWTRMSRLARDKRKRSR